MSWKSIACLVAVGAMTTSATAAPSIGIVDNGDGTGVVQITTDAAGALGVELALEIAGATLTSVTLADSVFFDTANPGDSPFIAGSVVGGDTMGLDDVDLVAGTAFAAFGSQPAAASTTYDFLNFSFTGTGTAQAYGLVAQGASLNDGLDTDLIDIDEVGIVFQDADFNMSGGVNLVDLNILGTGFGNFTGDATKADGDADGDGFVNLVDLNILGQQFDASSPATAVPEPATVAVAMIGLAAAGLRRRVA